MAVLSDMLSDMLRDVLDMLWDMLWVDTLIREDVFMCVELTLGTAFLGQHE